MKKKKQNLKNDLIYNKLPKEATLRFSDNLQGVLFFEMCLREKLEAEKTP